MNIFKFMMKWCSFNQILRISNNTMLYFVNASNTQNENFVMKLFLTTQKIAHYDVNIIICNTMNIVDYQKSFHKRARQKDNSEFVQHSIQKITFTHVNMIKLYIHNTN